MVALAEVRAHNATLNSLAPNLVAVFVGGTSGIGLSTAREFIRNTQSPHVYLVGRNETEASKIIPELQSINTSSTVEFIKSDISLIKNVDDVCRKIKDKESKVNLLFMTMGYFTMDGTRRETSEGLDTKFALHYYSRARFTQQLQPLLSAAANDADPKANLSRVVSVLDPNNGLRLAPNFDDLDLKNNFSLKNCATHASSMISFTHERFAAQNTGTSYVHAFPWIVPTNVAREVSGFMKPVWGALVFLLKPFSIDIAESGERHLYAATAPRFASKDRAEDETATGSDSVVGSGAYNVKQDGEVFAETANVKTLRGQGAVEKMWKHTQDVFGRIVEGGKV